MEIDYDTYDYEGNAVPEVPPLPSQGGKGRRMVSGFLKKLTPRKSRCVYAKDRHVAFAQR